MAGHKNGHGVFVGKDGSVYDGNYQRGLKEGYGVFKWSDGRVHDG